MAPPHRRHCVAADPEPAAQEFDALGLVKLAYGEVEPTVRHPTASPSQIADPLVSLADGRMAVAVRSKEAIEVAIISIDGGVVTLRVHIPIHGRKDVGT